MSCLFTWHIDLIDWFQPQQLSGEKKQYFNSFFPFGQKKERIIDLETWANGLLEWTGIYLQLMP